MGLDFAVRLFVGDFHFGLDRVACEDRGRIPDLVVAISHDIGIQALRPEDQPRADREGQVAMGNRTLERLGLAELRIRVMRLPVSGMHRVHHDISLGNGSGGGHVGLPDFEVFVKFMLVRHVDFS